MVKNIILQLFLFLKKPTDEKLYVSVKDKIRYLLILLLLTIPLVISTVPILMQIETLSESEFKRERDYHLLEVVIGVVIVMPIIEEFIFRYFLRYDTINNKLLSYNKWKILFPYFVYSSALSFALVHLVNYTFDSGWHFISILLVLPQLILGLVMTFIRVRFNFIYGILFHMLWNLLVMALIALIDTTLNG